VSRLVQSDLAATGQLNCRLDAPGRFFHLRAFDLLGFERLHQILQIAAHQIKYGLQQAAISVNHWAAVRFDRMHGKFGGRQREDQPAVAYIDVREFQNIPEEGAIRFRIVAVEQNVSARNHKSTYRWRFRRETLAEPLRIVKPLSFSLGSDSLPAHMRAAAILGLGCSESDLQPFQRGSQTEWIMGLPSAPEYADAILIFGGDGTFHRHLGALVKLGLPVLVVPLGSGNDFARALGLRSKHNSLAAWRRYVSEGSGLRAIDLGVITPLSMGELSGSDAAGCVATDEPGKSRRVTAEHRDAKYFCCVGGVGLDAEVARRANLLPRWLRRHGGYALSLPSALLHLAAPPMTLSVPSADPADGFTPRSSKPTVLAAFANTPHYGGGMTIAPGAEMDDGQLDICLLSDVNRFKLFCLFPTVYFGRHLGVENVEYFRAARLRIETETAMDVYADGEFVCHTPIEVTVAPQALRVITP